MFMHIKRTIQANFCVRYLFIIIIIFFLLKWSWKKLDLIGKTARRVGTRTNLTSGENIQSEVTKQNINWPDCLSRYPAPYSSREKEKGFTQKWRLLLNQFTICINLILSTEEINPIYEK